MKRSSGTEESERRCGLPRALHTTADTTAGTTRAQKAQTCRAACDRPPRSLHAAEAGARRWGKCATNIRAVDILLCAPSPAQSSNPKPNMLGARRAETLKLVPTRRGVDRGAAIGPGCTEPDPARCADRGERRDAERSSGWDVPARRHSRIPFNDDPLHQARCTRLPRLFRKGSAQVCRSAEYATLTPVITPARAN